MLLVKTKIAPSKIHGMGLFADQKIKKGEIIWKHNDLIDKIYRHDKLNELPELVKQYIRTYSWRDGNFYILCGDNGRFVNHSFEPNCLEDKSTGHSIAAKDIYPDEELTEDYRTFNDDYWNDFIAGTYER